MIVRAGTGWQYALADLSLILFLTMAAALAHAGGPKKAPPARDALPPAPIAAALDSEPVAVWSAGSGAPDLAGWLSREGADPRLEVRVVVRYVDGGRAAAVAQAVQLAESGGARASAARILVEPGPRAGASVSLTYASESAARSVAAMARPLAR